MISFGGPQGLNDIRPFLQNVVRGRRISARPARRGGASLRALRRGLPVDGSDVPSSGGAAARLEAAGRPLPVHVGMRNWHPFLEETLAEMSRAGVRRAVGLIAAAHRSYSSCLQYLRERGMRLARRCDSKGWRDVEATYVADWHTHDGFVDANVSPVSRRRSTVCLSTLSRSCAELIFTAHSIPVSMVGPLSVSPPVRRDGSCSLPPA